MASTRLPDSLRRTVVHPLEAAGAYLLFGLFRILPLDRASALGGWLARTIGRRVGITKHARRRLERAMPELSDAEIERILDAMWDNLGRVVAEYPHLSAFRIYDDGSRIERRGFEHVEPLLAAGKRIIFISGHYGNWEIASLAATQRGLDLVQVYRAANNPFVDKLIRRMRGMVGSELIPKGSVAARRALEAAREGRHIAMLVDQKMNEGIAVPFFGRPAMTAPAAAHLAMRYDLAIVPARVERIGGARFRFTVYPPIEMPRTGNRAEDAKTIMTRVNAVLESWIRERPEQWFWLHRRWAD